jgi:hypothetical protein
MKDWRPLRKDESRFGKKDRRWALLVARQRRETERQAEHLFQKLLERAFTHEPLRGSCESLKHCMKEVA